MKKIMCSFGTNDYTRSLDSLEQSAYKVGKIDKFYRYTREWLETTEFYKKNRYILDKPRGGGFQVEIMVITVGQPSPSPTRALNQTGTRNGRGGEGPAPAVRA